MPEVQKHRGQAVTQAELEALPIDGEFSYREEIHDGKRVRIPVLQTVGALWSEAHEPSYVTDIHGQRWRVGRGPDGRMYRQPARPLR